MPAVELDAARLVGGSEADRSRVLERVHEYRERQRTAAVNAYR